MTNTSPANDLELPNSLTIIPSFVKKGRSLTVYAKGTREAAITDISGRIIKIFKFNSTFSIETSQLHRGVYFLRLTDSQSKMQARKFVITD